MTIATMTTNLVEMSPAESDAGTEMTLRARFASEVDMTGGRLLLLDQTGAPAGGLPVTGFDGECYETGTLTLPAPGTPGEHQWSALPVPADEDSPRTEERFDFTVHVRSHRTRLLTWDVPSAVEAGAQIRISVGLKCSAGCDMAGRTCEVTDAAGRMIATGSFTGHIRPKTEALHEAEVELTAPDAAGGHALTVRVVGDDKHPLAEAPLKLNTTPQADAMLTLRATDSETGDPLPGQSVVMHPYRAMTDAEGIATLRVSKGAYTVFISGRGRYPMQRKIEIGGNITTEVALESEPPPSGNW